jgi:hypothetical protein
MAGIDPFSIIGDLVGKVVDLFPNPADKLKAQELQNQITLALNDAQTKLNQAQADIISSEAKSESWITRSWRPLVMLTFTALIVCHWFGLNAKDISEAQYIELFVIIKYGLSGYVVGRSGEKIAETVGQAFGKK